MLCTSKLTNVNSNFDGYTNSIYTITVGAIERGNQHPMYSEKCSANLVVTYSGPHGGQGIVTIIIFLKERQHSQYDTVHD